MRQRQAVVFGAGKMACGLLGQVLTQAGYAIQFVARRPQIIGALNTRGGYALVIAQEPGRRLSIRNCAALSVRDESAVAAAVAAADVVLTAVGVDSLAAITPAIARGLAQRGRAGGCRPLDVIACENLPGARGYLRHHVLSVAPPWDAPAVERVGGFSAALTRRIMTGGTLEDGELTFTVDAACDLIVDAHGLKAPAALEWATLTEEFPALVMRKLFLLNCAHAAAAYLGYREGCRYIHEAVRHPRVAPILRGALGEAQAALAAEFPHQAEAIAREAREALVQIANPYLADPISRVARDPCRKLSPLERLVGPARLASRRGLPHDRLCLAIAAALAYANPADPQAVAMQRAIRTEGVDRILTEACGLLPHEPLAREVKRHWASLVDDPARRASQPVPAAPLHSWCSPTLDEIMRSVAADLNGRYDPRLVAEVLSRVAQEFRSAG